MKKIRICILSHLYPVARHDYKGIFVKDLACSLAQKGFEIHVVTPRRPFAAKKEVSDNITIHRYGFFNWKKGQQLGQIKGLPIMMLGSLIAAGIITAVHVAVKNRIDLFHAYWVVPAGFMAAAAGMIVRRPAVATAAGSDLNTAASNRIVALFAGFTFKRIAALVCVSQALMEKAFDLGMSRAKSKVVPGPAGIDMKEYASGMCMKKRGSEKLKLLYTGNLEPPKRVDTLLYAAKQLKLKRVDFSLTIAGQGPDQEKLETLAQKLGIESFVEFKGRVDHDAVPELMHSCHVFVHCSENEGLPVAIMEAMAAGLPVVAAEVGGVPELVKEGITGFGLAYDDFIGFSEKIMILYENDDIRIKMGVDANRLIDEKFSRKKIVLSNIKVYSSILTEKKGRK